jgi:hypothetical protein
MYTIWSNDYGKSTTLALMLIDFLPDNIGTQRLELPFDVLIAPVDLPDVADDALPLGA